MQNSISRKTAFIALLSVLFFSSNQPVFADSGSTEDAKKIAKAIENYKIEAEKLAPSEIHKIIKADMNALSVTQKPGFDPTRIYNKTAQRSAGYILALEEKSKIGDPEATFFYGVYKLWECNGIRVALGGESSSLVNACYEQAMNNFKISAQSNIGSAAYNIAIMYSEGKGVSRSKYAAADWYIKACELFIENGPREMALTSIEEALKEVPDHPRALKIRNSLLE